MKRLSFYRIFIFFNLVRTYFHPNRSVIISKLILERVLNSSFRIINYEQSDKKNSVQSILVEWLSQCQTNWMKINSINLRISKNSLIKEVVNMSLFNIYDQIRALLIPSCFLCLRYLLLLLSIWSFRSRWSLHSHLRFPFIYPSFFIFLELLPSVEEPRLLEMWSLPIKSYDIHTTLEFLHSLRYFFSGSILPLSFFIWWLHTLLHDHILPSYLWAPHCCSLLFLRQRSSLQDHHP